MTPQRFDVGEIAIAQDWCEPYAGYNGTEVEVIAGLGNHIAASLSGMLRRQFGYHVRAADGLDFLVLPEQLKKRPPPREDLQVASWQGCPWRPEVTPV